MSATFKLTYGLFVLSAKDGEKDNGCIINTAIQVTSNPMRVSIAVNKENLTHDMIMQTGEFNVSILSQSTPFSVFQNYGMQTGKTADKVAKDAPRAKNGITYVPEVSCGVISGKVIQTLDVGTHTVFVADITEDIVLSEELQPVSYEYYRNNIKPAPEAKKKGFVCTICGFIYEGDVLPEDYICPICKHGVEAFEPLNQ